MTLGGARLRATTLGAAVTGAALAMLLALGGCAADPSAEAGGRPTHRPHTDAPGAGARPHPRPTPSAPPTPTSVGFDATAQSFDDPASTWVVVNKSRVLDPVAFAPPELVYPDVTYVNRQPMRPEVADALVAMFHAGKQEAGLDFSVQSAYRSFDSQTRVYDDDVARNGQAYADTDTARPGHSEHQTGLAVDISAVPAKCSLAACFADTPQGTWLAANAWRFGFLLRYPADKVPVTGFTFEPWHFRFIGVPLAAHLHATGVTTLEEFFHCAGGTEYH
ncbi:M15 family metallopeptidase [Leifsonia aquatica]|uniref:M15 family metallopeptidase n=1 Tax=Leifsonia aquatica TaxID=144185 RepID=UPI001F06359C|nr:M15 family metallopeptidase [Leifsonia aquatica]